MKVCVSFLVYNESASIEKTVKEGYAQLNSQNIDFELWVFDNCSTDNTHEILVNLQKERPRLKLYRQVSNVGYAMSTLSTFKVPDADCYITVDGDGQFSLKDVPKFIDKVKSGVDVVVGKRIKRNDPFDRVVMNKGFNLVTRFVLNSKLTDLNCGYRALSKKASDLIEVQYKEKFVGPEIYARAIAHKLTVTEVEVLHFERTAGVSVYSGSKLSSIFAMISYIFTLRKVSKTTPTNLETQKCVST